jgi:23S rRNA pseudouridine2605 synthase
VAELGDRAVPGSDEIAVDGIAIQADVARRYFALNKPPGVVSTVSDPQGRKTVLDLLEGAPVGGSGLFPVGRLDMDSTGLILLTNDGFLANRLMHPRFEVPREYVVEVEPVPRREDLARLRKGVSLEDGDTGPARVSLVGERGVRGRVRLVLHTGKKRQIRRSFEALGYRVVTLNRVRLGSLGLGNLRQGQYRELEGREVRELYRQTGFLESDRFKEGQ